jgi:hypothetical protein
MTATWEYKRRALSTHEREALATLRSDADTMTGFHRRRADVYLDVAERAMHERDAEAFERAARSLSAELGRYAEAHARASSRKRKPKRWPGDFTR